MNQFVRRAVVRAPSTTDHGSKRCFSVDENGRSKHQIPRGRGAVSPPPNSRLFIASKSCGWEARGDVHRRCAGLRYESFSYGGGRPLATTMRRANTLEIELL